MKLRNKKTGKIYNACNICFGESIDDLEKARWKTLKEFCDDWEDYEPTEPLIEDEKIRKAVRAWAEANDIKQVKYLYDGNILWFGDNEIDFKYLEPLALELNEYYTIEELCGSEK